MKTVKEKQIEQAVYDAFLKASFVIGEDIKEKIIESLACEKMGTAKNTLQQILDSYEIARKDSIAICQDCGMAIIFAEIGQDIHIEGDFNLAVQNGVRRAYKEGYLRKSVVRDPLFYRTNTTDNTPSIIYTDIVPGNSLTLTVVAKGFGSENCSSIKMFVPSDTIQEIKDFIINTAVEAGPNSCPPVIVGVGIGGTMEKAALLAKKSLLRDINTENSDPRYALMESEILDGINSSGIGPSGLGGRTTAIAVNIETYATHIAAIPVAVNLCCHASRHAKTVL